MGMPVDMIIGMAKVFNTLDVGLSFNSTEQLPENVRSQFANEMNKIGEMTKPRHGGWTDADKEMFEVMFNGMSNSANMYAVCPDVGRLHVELNGSKFSSWFKKQID